MPQQKHDEQLRDKTLLDSTPASLVCWMYCSGCHDDTRDTMVYDEQNTPKSGVFSFLDGAFRFYSGTCIMADSVFMFGAGINRCVADRRGFQPPLATDLFQQALKHPKIGGEGYRQQFRFLYHYIQQYWKLSVDDLALKDFDLEACYTFIQQERSEAEYRGDEHTWRELVKIEYQLTALFAEFLAGFEHPAYESGEFRTLAQMIWKERAAVLTFNYDTLLETVIELASGSRAEIPASLRRRTPPDDEEEVPFEELACSRSNWNPGLAYGVRFDEVALPHPGITRFVLGERFYAHPNNQLYNCPFLKLHGSINWFFHTGFNILSSRESSYSTQPVEAGSTVLDRGVGGAFPSARMALFFNLSS